MNNTNEAVLREALEQIADLMPATSEMSDAHTMGQIAIDALAATATVASAEQPAGDDNLVAAWFAANDKYTNKADFDAWLEQAFRDGLKEGRSLAAPISEDSIEARNQQGDVGDELCSDLETLLAKLHSHWGDCLWIDASELMALEKSIEQRKADKKGGK